MLGGQAAFASLTKSLVALNPDYAPATGFLNGEMAKVLDRDIAKLLEPIRRDMNQRAAAAMAPFRELMVSQTAETLKKLTPIVAEQIRLPKIPMSTSLPQQLAELAALTAPLVPGVVAEKIEEASRQVSKARGRTPEEIVAYVNLCVTLITLLIAIVQFCATQNQPPSSGGTVNQTINNSPTNVINNTTVVLPPAPIVAPPPRP
ncbi:hypothetical protein [Mycolicibacterium fluoranthenivorans]|uniref:Uncharacterized protein n=1 Tax=Mycolicibacterium fluoranthenivorans TaxID=258505 RepID=A0A7X5TZQ9_9MYCO|nr:hypothetical protein [Mycolicibacterium fluoranthenivorans]MCV7358155.1 hypothetical protein [Mycolicibacterium fluoranthenivorans]NIH95724.1 hypothetical protein [Mycolicibacterium fluoranthenivorans]